MAPTAGRPLAGPKLPLQGRETSRLIGVSGNHRQRSGWLCSRRCQRWVLHRRCSGWLCSRRCQRWVLHRRCSGWLCSRRCQRWVLHRRCSGWLCCRRCQRWVLHRRCSGWLCSRHCQRWVLHRRCSGHKPLHSQPHLRLLPHACEEPPASEALPQPRHMVPHHTSWPAPRALRQHGLGRLVP